MKIRPISIRKANDFVEQNHRHHGSKTGCKFALSLVDDDGDIHGVAICANPVARQADDGKTLEVSRLCTDGTYNACSMLYGACARVAKEMGYSKIITYILQSESGTSLKASGWVLDNANCGALDWESENNKRQKERNQKPQQLALWEDKKPPKEKKQRYIRILDLRGD